MRVDMVELLAVVAGQVFAGMVSGRDGRQLDVARCVPEAVSCAASIIEEAEAVVAKDEIRSEEVRT